jgi:hypothetical protein
VNEGPVLAVTEARAADALLPASEDRRAYRDPIVVLTYAHAGAEVLAGALSASRSLTCTTGTGLLPLCHAAAMAWQNAEGPGWPSPLAIKSIRAMAATMVTVIQARAGATRWCETAIAPPAAAGTFLRVFPETTFLCLHRNMTGVIADGTAAYPWGLGGSPFWPYSAGHPGNNVATIAAYWTACAQALLEFEDQHPQSCVRVKHEDFTAELDLQTKAIYTRLGLGAGDLTVPPQSAPNQSRTSADRSDIGFAVPAHQIPSGLRPKINEIHSRLNYAPPW